MMSKNKHENFWKKYSNSGMTLVEILIAVVLVGAIAVGVMNLTQQTSKSTAKIELTSDLTSTANEINALLSDPVKCRLTFQPTLQPSAIASSYDDTIPVPVKLTDSYQVYTSANKATIGAANLKILSYRLVKNLANPEDSSLEITFENKEIINKNEPTIKKTLSMYVEWNGNVVEECRTLAGSTSTIWTRGTGTNIYYDGGNVGINTSNPTAALHVVGNVVTDKITASSFMYSSDKKLKENITSIENPLNTVLALRGVNFDWRDTKENDFGFIAQEIQKQIPEIVSQNESIDALTVDYAKVIPFLVEALKIQQKEIKDLERKITDLEKSAE
jgi:prepilin-type N-terminal cleavage/methylation domain-containing protein